MVATSPAQDVLRSAAHPARCPALDFLQVNMAMIVALPLFSLAALCVPPRQLSGWHPTARGERGEGVLTSRSARQVCRPAVGGAA